MYGVFVYLWGFEYLGVMNVGVKLIFGLKLFKIFEVYILDFNDVIYGEIV